MNLCQDYQISFIQIDPNNSLTRNPTHKLDFIIMTFCGITEPDPIPWFPKWSTGKILILLWSAFLNNAKTHLSSTSELIWANENFLQENKIPTCTCIFHDEIIIFGFC